MNKKGESLYLFTTEGHLYPIKYAYKLRDRNSRDEILGDKGKTQQRTSQKPESCRLNMSSGRFRNLKHNLPMKMQYFDQLFEMVGVNDNLDHLLERKKM